MRTINPILILINHDYNPKEVAKKYIEEFNKNSQITILKYVLRYPTDKEIESAKVFYGRKFKRNKNVWEVEDDVNGDITYRIAFIIEPTEQNKIPDALFKARKNSQNQIKAPNFEACKK